ncbi:MAG: DEAD/DEAH box helicase family protein [Fibrobacteraceae bacterium]
MTFIKERADYQRYILNYLKDQNGYIVRKDANYDRTFAMDRELLFEFLDETQPEQTEKLRKIFKGDYEETVVNSINNKMTGKGGSLLDLLKHGVEIDSTHLDLMYTRPATDFNKDLLVKYQKNIFSVAEEVWASEKERVDLVIFLNGFAIITFELKCNAAGQSTDNAEKQYQFERDPKTRLFSFKLGALVNFAMDLEEVYMSTKIEKTATTFLPFNKGRGIGIDAGAGNPASKDSFSVAYMWEDVLKKDSLLELVNKFIFLEVKEDIDRDTGKKKRTENIIFPRFHQRDAVQKILADVYEYGTSQNYLIQHSAGSGKTKTIAWLAYRLSSFHNAQNKVIFDNILIVTDRVVVDRQLQAAIKGMEHKAGLIRVMDKNCTSADLKAAIVSNTKIIVTTIQKFPYIVDEVKKLEEKSFAVIIDEAHSSTAGKNMEAVAKVLGSADVELEDADAEDIVMEELAKHGKQSNVSMFAFTATPKPTTLQLFGRTNKRGQKEAFHLYSMKQAIEEGFILDVLQNYTTYDTYYHLNKSVDDDPRCNTKDAKRQIARFVELHESNIAQRIEIIIEHFRSIIQEELGGSAKAMVITAGREEAVRYKQAFETYIAKKGYADLHALVAFSGKLKIKGDGKEYTESGINGFSEEALPEKFDKEDYQVLLVANKYQTGFDQKKLCAMYILKKLNGVNAVQTLSRLNRICPPYDKKTFVLDFVNDYKDMEEAFAKFYTSTLLSNTINPKSMYDLDAKVDGYHVIDTADVDAYFAFFNKGKMSEQDQINANYLFHKTQLKIETFDDEKRNEIIKTLRGYVRFYEFLIQATCFKDLDIHKKYYFVSSLLPYLKTKVVTISVNLFGKIKADNFVQKKKEERRKSSIASNPVIKLPTAETIVLSEDKEAKLSEIIAEINSLAGKNFDKDVVTKAMLQVRDIMLKDDKLKTSAQSNTEKDFEFAYYDNIDETLVEGLEKNEKFQDQIKDFFTLMLNRGDFKKQVMGIFAESVYDSLKRAARG